MRVLITTERIQERLSELAQQIGPEYRDRPLTIVGVLTGSLMFLADLVRRLDVPLRIGLIQASSYRGGTTSGELHLGTEILADVHGRHVLLLDDILDTGHRAARVRVRPRPRLSDDNGHSDHIRFPHAHRHPDSRPRLRARRSENKFRGQTVTGQRSVGYWGSVWRKF